MTNPQMRSHAVVATVLLTGLLLAPRALADADGLPIAEPESVGMSSERLQRIETGLGRLIDAGHVPGTVTLVARRGKIVHFEAAGLRNVEAGLPMERDTIFRLYSQTKPVTGAAVMMLFEEGHFLMTDPIGKYLPELAEMEVYVGEQDGEIQTEPATAPITIQHLATHTAGLTYGFFPTPVGQLYGEHPVLGDETFSGGLEAWVHALAELPLVAQPGTEWHYSVGMDVLGRLVEVVSGMSFGEFLKQRIFDPLGMVDTGFHVPDDKLDRFAANYTPTPDGGMQLIDDPETSPYRRPPGVEMGGGGLVGTAGDYLKFAQMLANKGEYGGKRLLGRRTVEFMTANHLTPDFPRRPDDDAVRDAGRRGPGVGRRLRHHRLGHHEPCHVGPAGIAGHLRLGWCRDDALLGGSRGGTRGHRAYAVAAGRHLSRAGPDAVADVSGDRGLTANVGSPARAIRREAGHEG